jgi:tetratricopeptide (TPR) repeat protein
MWNLESWYDRSHDVFFDWLIAGGILGLLSYLSLYAVALFLMWGKRSTMPVRERAIMTGLLAGYFIHNIFVFDNLISYIMFFFLLAYIAWRTDTRGAVHEGRHVSPEMLTSLYAPAFGILLIASAYFMVWKPIQVNHDLVKGLDINRLVQSMPVADAVAVQEAAFQRAIAANVVGSEEAREQFLQTTVRMAQVTIPEDVSAEDKQKTVAAINKLILAARTEVTNSYEAHKNDIRLLSIYGMFYNGLGDGVSAEGVLAQAHTLAPKKQLISFDLVRAYLVQNKTAEAYTLAKETFDYAPAYPDATKTFLVAAAYANKWQEAKSYVASKGGSTAFDPDVLSALVGSKQISAAIAYLNELKAANPSYATQVDAYIKQLLAGQGK